MQIHETQIDKGIVTNLPPQEKAIEQEYNRPTERYYRDSPELGQ